MSSGTGGTIGSLGAVSLAQYFGASGASLPIVGALGGGIFGGTSGFITGALFGLTAMLNQTEDEEIPEVKIDNNNFKRNTPVPICYGTDKFAGTVVAIGRNETRTVTSGGKGGLMGSSESSSETEYTTYYAEFAVAFCEGPITGYANIFINDTEIDETEDYVYLEYNKYIGDTTQTTSPYLYGYLYDENLVDTSVPWRNTAYILCTGTIGLQAYLPVMSAEVVGFYTYYTSRVLMDWSIDYDQMDILLARFYLMGLGWRSDATYGEVSVISDFNVDTIYFVRPSDGNVYKWTPSEDTERTLISDSVSLGFQKYAGGENCVSRLVDNRYFYIVTARKYGYYDIFYIDTEDDSVISLQKDIRLSCSEEDYTEWFGGLGYTQAFGSIEVLEDVVLLFGGSGVYSSYYDDVYAYYSEFMATLNRESGTLQTVSFYKNLAMGYVESPTINTVNILGTVFASFTNNPTGGYPYRNIHFNTSGFVLSYTEELAQPPVTDRWAIRDVTYYDGQYYAIRLQYTSGSNPNTLSLIRVTDLVELTFETIYEWNYTSTPGFENSNNSSRNLVQYNGKLYIKVPGLSSPFRQTAIYSWDNYKGFELEIANANFTQATYLYSCSNRISEGVSGIEIWSMANSFYSPKDANPIECTYDFMTNPRYGMGIPTSYFDGDPWTAGSGSWSDEWEYCQEGIKNDENVWECRFLYSNAFTERKKAYDIINDILQTCRGFIYYCDGKIKVKIEKAGEEPVLYFSDRREYVYDANSCSKTYITLVDYTDLPENYFVGDIGEALYYDEGYGSFPYGENGYGETTAYPMLQKFSICSQEDGTIFLCDALEYEVPQDAQVSITKDNIKKNSFTYSRTSFSNTNNRIRLEYCDRDDDYRTNVLEEDNYYNIELTGEIREKTFSMKGIKRDTQARRMLTFLSGYDQMVTWQCNFGTDIVGGFLCIGDVIGVTREELSWYGKLFRITSLDESSDYEFTLQLIEYIPGVYNDYGYISGFVSDIPTSYDNTDKRKRPEQVVPLHLFEDRASMNILVAYGKPLTTTGYEAGAMIYHRRDDSSTWSTVGKSYGFSTRFNTLYYISATSDTIYFDVNSVSGTLSSSGSFWLEDEQISYYGIDEVNGIFYNCLRGQNDSEASSHAEDTYGVIIGDNIFRFEYTALDIGHIHYFRAGCFTIFDILSDSANFPEESITISGYSTLPYPVSSLMVALC